MLDNFYMDKFYDYEKPMLHLMFNVEGNVNYSTLLFIPNLPPRNLHSIDYEKGLQLYSKGVFIMDKCKELIPDYLRFVKGVVDSSDLSLNISREMLQQNKVLLLMQKNIEKKIINRLQALQKEDFAICIRGSLGKFCFYPLEVGAIASSLVILRANEIINKKYLYYYLCSGFFYEEIKRFNNGTAQPNLAAGDLIKFLFPLPPLAEQEKIVEIIEQILPLCEKLGG